MRTSALIWVLFVSGALTGCREPNAPQPPVAAEQARSQAEEVSAGQNTPAQPNGDVVALERLDVANASEESYCNI